MRRNGTSLAPLLNVGDTVGGPLVSPLPDTQCTLAGFHLPALYLFPDDFLWLPEPLCPHVEAVNARELTPSQEQVSTDD